MKSGVLSPAARSSRAHFVRPPWGRTGYCANKNPMAIFEQKAASQRRKRAGGAERGGGAPRAPLHPGAAGQRGGSRAGTASAACQPRPPCAERFFSIRRHLAHQCSRVDGKKKDVDDMLMSCVYIRIALL